MASPPPFNICDDLDDDDEPTPAHRHHPAVAPTPNGLNDRLLRLTRTRPHPNPNPNPNPPPPEAAAEQVRKVKLAGRRRLCKLSAPSLEQDDDEQDGDSIRDILDDLTTRLDSLSVHRSNPTARPRKLQEAPLPCTITTDLDDQIAEDGDSHATASTPIQVSSSDESTAITRQVKVKSETTSVASAFTDYTCDVKGKSKDAGMKNRIAKASSFANSDDHDFDSDSYSDDGAEEEGTARDFAVKHVIRRKTFTRRLPKASTLRSYEDDDGDLGKEKENHGVAENDADDVGWEKTEDFKMEPTGSSATSKSYKLPGRIFKMLYPHQREGLRWLWVLHCRGAGGILGDDMGLGKTMQVSAFLAGLFHSRLIKRVLIVAPKTLLAHWNKELSVVGLKEKIRDFSGPSTNIRNYELQYAFKEGGVLLTTYDIVRNNYKLIRGNSFNGDDDEEEGTLWNYVILDEGHLIKNNKTQRAQSLFEIPCIHRIVISGTPIQNNLKEMWALFNFCCPDVLGDKQQFKTRYEMDIIRGNDKNATAREKHIGSNVAKELRERIKPYFLRRMKTEVFLESDSSKGKTLAKKMS